MAQMTALTAALPWRALLPTQTLQSASALQTRCPVLTVPSAKIAQAFRYLMCARLVRDWLTTNARTARIWVRDPLITSALSAAPSWRALLPTQTLHSASALQTRCPVLTVPSAKIAQAFRYLMCARLVRDWLMTSAFNATTSWRALLLTKSLQSASALKARFPVRTVPSVRILTLTLDFAPPVNF